MFPRCASRLRRPAEAEEIRYRGIAKATAREMRDALLFHALEGFRLKHIVLSRQNIDILGGLPPRFRPSG
jgi:hypothetical protein